MAVLPKHLVDHVAEIITRYSMIPIPSRIGVAVSGGADSVALLHILHRLRERFQASLTVLHVNHGLRGAESDQDEAFVGDLAKSLSTPFLTERSQLASGNLEAAARESRRKFFCRMQKEAGLDRVALGHTRSDQAETVLFRFLRGAGTAGLAGMQYVSVTHGLIRPLLKTERQEVRDWAASEGIAWRDDSTNADVRFRRNRLRLETLPRLAANYNSNLESVLAGMAEIAQAENDYWEPVISQIYGKIAQPTRLGVAMNAGELNALQRAVQRRLIRHGAVELRGDLRGIDLEHVEAILLLCTSKHGHDRSMVPGIDAMRSFDTLLLTTPGTLNQEREYRFEVEIGREVVLPYSAGRFCLEPVNSQSHFCANFKEEPYLLNERVDLDWDTLSIRGPALPLILRNWQPGDTIERAGHERPEKLKTLFQEYRIPLWDRRHWPVLVSGLDVVWTRRFGCAVKYKKQPGSRWLRLSYRAENEEYEPGLNRKRDI
jgi:tRNA(Ile)-lysidine synthase